MQLPSEIDRYIFNELGAIYERNYERANFNLEINKEDISRYIGTYWPRSFAETYSIFNDLFSSMITQSIFSYKKSINIFDIGSGTGGNLFGLLYFIKKHFPDKEISIISYDGNREALIKEKEIMKKFFPKIEKQMLSVKPRDYAKIESKAFTVKIIENILKKYVCKFDIIMSSKVVNEFYKKDYDKNKGMYNKLTETISHSLSQDGFFILSDVTDKASNNVFLPKLMNEELTEYLKNPSSQLRCIIPLSCAFWFNACRNPKNCFIQKKIEVSHTGQIQGEVSKICYRVFTHKKLADALLHQIKKYDEYRLADSDNKPKSSYCFKGTSKWDDKNKYRCYDPFCLSETIF